MHLKTLTLRQFKELELVFKEAIVSISVKFLCTKVRLFRPNFPILCGELAGESSKLSTLASVKVSFGKLSHSDLDL